MEGYCGEREGTGGGAEEVSGWMRTEIVQEEGEVKPLTWK